MAFTALDLASTFALPQVHLLIQGMGPIRLDVRSINRIFEHFEDHFSVDAVLSDRLDLLPLIQGLRHARLVISTDGHGLNLFVARYNVEYMGHVSGTLRLSIEAVDDNHWQRHPSETHIHTGVRRIAPEAEARAKSLLEQLLSPEQREQYCKTGRFTER